MDAEIMVDLIGFYDKGQIGAIVLEGITGRYRNAGLPISDVSASRKFDERNPLSSIRKA